MGSNIYEAELWIGSYQQARLQDARKAQLLRALRQKKQGKCATATHLTLRAQAIWSLLIAWL